MSEPAVLTEVADGVMTITINRPQAKNAVNKDVAVGIAAALDALDADDNTHVVILTGAGGTFCSGMDLKAFVTGETPYVEGRGFAGMVQRSTDKPLIAAVEGYALAGGCELAITCDLIVAAENSKFGIPEVKRGLAAAAEGVTLDDAEQDENAPAAAHPPETARAVATVVGARGGVGGGQGQRGLGRGRRCGAVVRARGGRRRGV